MHFKVKAVAESIDTAINYIKVHHKPKKALHNREQSLASSLSLLTGNWRWIMANSWRSQPALPRHDYDLRFHQAIWSCALGKTHGWGQCKEVCQILGVSWRVQEAVLANSEPLEVCCRGFAWSLCNVCTLLGITRKAIRSATRGTEKTICGFGLTVCNHGQRLQVTEWMSSGIFCQT